MSGWLAGRVAALTAAALLAAGCGGAAPGPGGDTGDGGTATATGGGPGERPQTTTPRAEPPTETGATAPPVEPSRTVEAPLPSREDSVALEVAGLPVGGFAEPLTDADRCVHVNWSGPPDIPAGVRVRATSVVLEPSGVYEVVPGLCPGPPCLGGDHVVDQAIQCVVGVRQVATTVDGFGALGVAGTVTCDVAAVCRDLATEVAARGPDTIAWFDALTSAPEPTGDPTTEDGGDTVTRTG